MTVQHLSDYQEKVLAILPIPSAIFSVGGSVAIIYIAIKQKRVRKWNPYTRLLVAMSFCDILFSITIAIATFLRPRDTSSRVWAFGNDSTCSFVGFSQQLWSMSAILYNAMLSFYFLLTTRFGIKNSRISKCTEPVMHLLAIGYPLVTAIVGSALGLYGESAIALSCWVTNYMCDENGEHCVSQIIAWFYYAIPVLGVFASLAINNTAIIIFVRRNTLGTLLLSIKQQMPPTEMDSTSSEQEENGEMGSPLSSNDFTLGETSCNPLTKCEEAQVLPSRQEKKLLAQTQARRLRLVSTQSLLFVLSFFICNVWSGILALAESAAKTDDAELQMLVKYYPICILQSFFVPLQGFFNMIVYIRPRYILTRHEFPDKSRTWAIRRVFLGDNVGPKRAAMEVKLEGKQNRGNTLEGGEKNKQSMRDGVVPSENKSVEKPPVNRKRDAISSLTASRGDFDSEVHHDSETKLKEAEETGNSTNPTRFQELKSSIHRYESLEVISELSASVFDPITVETTSSYQRFSREEQHMDPQEILPPPSEPILESRWKSHIHQGARIPAMVDDSDQDRNPPPSDSTASSQADAPIKLPVRKHSPTAPPKRGVEATTFAMDDSVGDSSLCPPKRRLSMPLLMDDA